MTHWYWSTLLAGFGLVGLYLAGRNNYWGWVLGLLDEALWIAYALLTRQWAFCLSALAYGWVYGRNLRAWLRATPTPAAGPGMHWAVRAARWAIDRNRSSSASQVSPGPVRGPTADTSTCRSTVTRAREPRADRE